ncbi:heavy-metal-associated domain-containing protein [Aquimarina mytili]|uniref:Heavy-metal-associated domain-containing protein n=1 Tax=Aquimarina mytili TaxID=874423 RepID=A0A936ZLS9_9FLAO|nr:heavy metal-associated domain-containing protein [Aquimarina mytili]MBL0682019.1 heavy-metal-associated domain-containing protein [Aquimarina mytili]
MKTTIAIQNLKCSGCENMIINKLSTIKGIKDISINIENHMVSYSYETPNVTETVQKELSKLGYPIQGDKNGANKKVKSYISCAIGRLIK